MGEIPCQLGADAERSNAITFYMQCTRNGSAQILSPRCSEKRPNSCITEYKASASHQRLALRGPTGKTTHSLIRILPPHHHPATVLGLNSLFVFRVYMHTRMFSPPVATA